MGVGYNYYNEAREDLKLSKEVFPFLGGESQSQLEKRSGVHGAKMKITPWSHTQRRKADFKGAGKI